jgi:hypothetical protein
MAIETLLHIRVKDAQILEETLTFAITGATFSDTTLPTAAHIQTFISKMFGDAASNSPSGAIVQWYSVEVRENAPVLASVGEGGVGLNIAGRLRSNLSTAEEWEFRLPGLVKDRVNFGFSDPNQIITVGTLWDDIRAAGAVADLEIHGTKPGNTFVAQADLLQEGILFNGRRSPRRVR